MVILRHICIILLLSWFVSGQISAKPSNDNIYRSFWMPMFQGQRLDYCDLEHHLCGKCVADRYCQIMGYKESDQQIIEYNVGLTNYIDTRMQCRGWTCSGFKLIHCATKMSHKPPLAYMYRERKFVFPRYDHYRVDWCYKDGKGCGQRAAHSFCRRMGYLRERSYKKQERIWASRSIGDQKLCFGSFCTGFSQIVCHR
jgi:hypothetical protein